MKQDDVDVIGESLGKIAVAAARAIGDLAIAVGNQPGVDANRLIADFLAQLPPSDDPALGIGAPVVAGIRTYLEQEAS